MAPITRRQLVQGTTAASVFAFGLPSRSFARPPRRSPNEEIRVAVAGIRSRGGSHIGGLERLEGVRVVALCDPDRDVLAKKAADFEKKHGRAVDTTVDVRRVLDRDDVDVLATASPNHWHALMTVWACQAGKDVYVEKPVSHNVWEGRQMVRAAEKYGRVVQTGTQSRSSPGIAEGVKFVREGKLGRILYAHGTCYKPRKSIGKVEGAQRVPSHVDYDLWVGPAPMKPLTRRSLHYDWHWVFDTGNGDLGNQGIHQVDMCRWGLGYGALSPRVMSMGGRFGYDDDGNTPNTLITFHDYPGAPLIFEVRGLPRDKAAQSEDWGGRMDRLNGMAIGATIVCENGQLRIPNYGESVAYDADGNEIERWRESSDHFANFIAAVRARDVGLLNSNILEGHLSSALCHTGNISYLLGRTKDPREVVEASFQSGPGKESFERFLAHLDANEVDPTKDNPSFGPWLEMDPATERFVGNAEADALLTRDYRRPFVVPEEV